MIQLDVGGRRYTVVPGEMIIGSDDGVAIPVFSDEVAPRHAVVQGWPDGSAAVRPLGEAGVSVNGVRLAAEPSPLLHGDKVVVGGPEILVVDEARAGRTRIARGAQVMPPPDGARVVCLTDGREYALTASPLVFGREAGADVVVPGGEVSRRHAELHRDATGYLLLDASVNGTTVNGERVSGERRLAPGDVIRIGDEDFRFHAPPAPPIAAPTGAAARLSDTMFGMQAFQSLPPAPEAPATVPLASVLFRSGARKGERVTLTVPVINVGRADYNDLVLADPSVSTMHAKLQRRDGVWILSDLGSTNGTFMEGEPVVSETALAPGATVRFGEVSVLFEPLDAPESPAAPAETRVMPRLVEPTPYPVPPAPPVVTERPARSPAPRRPVPPPPPRRRVSWVTVTLLMALAAAAAAYLLTMR